MTLLKNELPKGLQSYYEDIKDILKWLDSPKTADEFDSWAMKQELGPCLARYLGPNDFILGSLHQGVGPDCWAGKLDLLQHLVSLGLVRTETKYGKIIYKQK